MNEYSNRSVTALVVGDVGSGKTYIAILTSIAYLDSLKNIREKASVTLAAPTEVLAYQHYLKYIEVYEKILQHRLLNKTNSYPKIEIVLLTAKRKIRTSFVVKDSTLLVENKTFKRASDLLFSMSKMVVIGTHAIFNNKEIEPALVMVDEQHRFGINQRNVFNDTPHNFISFTATPIPRTLALSLFSNLDTYFVDKLLSRKEVKTTIMQTQDFASEGNLLEMRKTIGNGGKIFVICPSVSKKESNDDTTEEIASVEEIYDIINKIFPDIVLAIHGKDKNKQARLIEFRDNEKISILISTTVVEVGVDVSLARCIYILNAERFGMSALHQLRGRVGRNDVENNSCYLVTDKKYTGSNKLKFITTSSDGFEIAKKDLEMRGSGEIFGKLQSGYSEEVEAIYKIKDTSFEEMNKYLEINSYQTIEKNLPRLAKYITKRSQDTHLE